MTPASGASVVAVCANSEHGISKVPQPSIRLLEGLGVEGDAHLGETVQHRSRLAKEGHLPNLRQVHLLHVELHEALRARGFEPAPGAMGENVLTHGVDLLALPLGA